MTDPLTEIPPIALLPTRYHRKPPWLYQDEDIARLAEGTDKSYGQRIDAKVEQRAAGRHSGTLANTRSKNRSSRNMPAPISLR